MASLNDKHYSSTSAQEQGERGDFKEDEREKEPIGTKVIEPRKGRGLPVCEDAAPYIRLSVQEACRLACIISCKRILYTCSKILHIAREVATILQDLAIILQVYPCKI